MINKSNAPNDLGYLLKAHFRGEVMEDTYRRALLEKTRRLVAAAGGQNLGGILGGSRSRRWAWGALAAGAAILLLAGLIWSLPHPPKTAQTRPPTAPTIIAPPAPAAQGPLTPTKPIAAKPAPGRQHQAALPAPPKINRQLAAVISLQDPVIDQSGRALELGEHLPAGAVIITGAEGRVTLITQQGSEFTLAADTTLALARDGKSAELRRGRLYLRNRRQEFTTLCTSAGAIELLGTTVDAAVKDEATVAVTVVEGKVRLANSHGEVLVEAGEKSLLQAAQPPTRGKPVNVATETAWYDGRIDVISDFGDIAYTLRREASPTVEIWAMKADGSGKHRLKGYFGFCQNPAIWLPGEQTLLLKVRHDLLLSSCYLVNAVTGQDWPFQLPSGYDPSQMVLSPDGRRLAFTGGYRADPDRLNDPERGLWVIDLDRGKIKKLLDGDFKTRPAWAPDSRRLALSNGEHYTRYHNLVIVDAVSGAVTDLHTPGSGPTFSPDGGRIAYNGDYPVTEEWLGPGLPQSHSIYVLDLEEKDRQPRLIAPKAQNALMLHWSPDGGKLVYLLYHGEWVDKKHYSGHTVLVAAADGSGVKEIFRQPMAPGGDYPLAASWTPDGKNIYVLTRSRVLLIDAGGGGLIADLGGNEQDSVLPPGAKTQTSQAGKALLQARTVCGRAHEQGFSGEPAASRKSYQAAAEIFAGILWRYPLSGLSANELLSCADRAAALGSRSDREILADSCQRRIAFLSAFFDLYLMAEGRCPPDLPALEAWLLSHGWDMGSITYKDTAKVNMMFRCPRGDDYRYAPPPPGVKPQIGAVLVTCPNHPEYQVVWDRILAWSWVKGQEATAKNHN